MCGIVIVLVKIRIRVGNFFYADLDPYPDSTLKKTRESLKMTNA